MRARAGDPPRTMPQKILGGRSADPLLRADIVDVKVDQVILSRAPMRAFAEATALGMKKTPVEVAVAYDGICVTSATTHADEALRAPSSLAQELIPAGLVVARAGIGFPASVQLERFAAPARLAVTDDPRLASTGGAGMLTLVVSPGQLGQALALGTVSLRPPRSIQILFSGRLRPFVSARDAALELLRRGLGEIVRGIEAEFQAPVIIEFAGPSLRHLSVAERAILCGIAPRVGAAGAICISDEKTEVFLRDQRRSKAYRALVPDPGAPCEEVITVDLSAVDPLIVDEKDEVRPVRELAETPVHQIVLGGDSGVTLRDLITAAALLKSKRVPAHLDFLLASPSRQILEVLAQSGALADLFAAGARLVEPDQRLLTGELYPPAPGEFSLRTQDSEPRADASATPLVASAETAAYAVSTGEIGDPRGFKRPVRVTVPRTLPTDDVLILRDRRGDSAPHEPLTVPPPPPPSAWGKAMTIEIIEGLPSHHHGTETDRALLLRSLDEVRQAAQSLDELDGVRVVIASFIPSALVPLFADVGIAALEADDEALKALEGERRLELPALGTLDGEPTLTAKIGEARVSLSWLAIGRERRWTKAGTSRPSTKSRSN